MVNSPIPQNGTIGVGPHRQRAKAVEPEGACSKKMAQKRPEDPSSLSRAFACALGSTGTKGKQENPTNNKEQKRGNREEGVGEGEQKGKAGKTRIMLASHAMLLQVIFLIATRLSKPL